ncbi:MAG: hypothetical protein J6Q67_04040 [Clostridia bacterium]|nr:hypothetical protein [Clostridia bacterium]
MKKISRIMAFVLVLIMAMGAFTSTFAASAGNESVEATAWDKAIDKLYAWGIIEEDEVAASKDLSKKLDRQVFALWTAKILVKEFGENILDEIDKATTGEDGFKTGYDDVDESTEALYRRAIAYVTANGLFEGYGIDAYGKNKFGPVYYKDDTGYSEGVVELYQACKVIISLLSRWKDEFNTTYIDEVKTYDKYFGDGTQRSEGTAYLWEAMSLKIVDAYYMENCAEYFWDSDLNYGEAAYMLVKAIESVKPASCAGGCEHGDENKNDILDCYIADSMTIKPREALLTGVIKAPTAGDVLTNENVTVSVLVGYNRYIDVTFTAEEFTKIAIDDNGKVDLTTGENGYEFNTIVSIKYYGNIFVLEKAEESSLSEKEIRYVHDGILGAYNEQTGEATVVPVAGYSYYSTYLVNKNGEKPTLSINEKLVYDRETNKLTYKGVEYVIASASDNVEGNKIVARINGVEVTPADFAAEYKNFAQGEMYMVFCDLEKDSDNVLYEYVEIVDCRDFAPLHTGLNEVLGNGKALSYILYNRDIAVPAPDGLAFAISAINPNNGLMIALCTESSGSKISPCYTYTSVYYAENTESAFNTVKGFVSKVEDAEEGYYKVTFENGSTAIIPTENKLSGAMNTEFFYTVAGDWASKIVNINYGAKSWFKTLAAVYRTMSDDKAQLVSRYIEVVLGADGKAVHVAVDGVVEAENTFGTGYITKAEKTADDNILRVTLNKVGLNGVVETGTFDINLALTASYSYDVGFVKDLLSLTVYPVSEGKIKGYADIEQLIFAEVKTDGLGRYVLAKAEDDDFMRLSGVFNEKIIKNGELISSVIYADDGSIIRSSETERLKLTQDDLEKKSVKLVNTYTEYVAKDYRYEAVISDGKVVGYVLTAGAVEYIRKVRTEIVNGVNMSASETSTTISSYVKNENGEWVDENSVPVFVDVSINSNANITSGIFVVNGRVIVDGVEGYTLHIITPSASSEEFVFTEISADANINLTILKYNVNSKDKTITIFGEICK